MKKCISILLIMCTVLMMAACAEEDDKTAVAIASFAESYAPAQVVKTDNYWVYLLNQYGSRTYEIAVGSIVSEVQSVYKAENVSIWYMEANDNYIAWCEQSGEYYEYKVYSMEDKTIETIHKAFIYKGHQPQNVGVYEDKIFYGWIDYDVKKADIYCYDMDTQKSVSVYSLSYRDDLSIMSFAVENQYLSVAGPSGIGVKDLTTDEKVYQCDLPDGVEYVFSVSYDYENKKCAIYYADKDSEDIGVISEDKTKVDSHYTFAANHYAYHDTIKCLDGHIYWIRQADVTGDVTDHYVYVDYDYLNKEPVETIRTFDVFVNDTNAYYLSYDKAGDYEKILLYEK